MKAPCQWNTVKEKRGTGNGERKTTRFPMTVPRSSKNAAFSGSVLLGPVFFLVTVPAQFFLALMLVHLLLALFSSPGHCFLRL